MSLGPEYDYEQIHEETCPTCDTKFKTKLFFKAPTDAFMGYEGTCPKCGYEPAYG